jgi:beta-carotene ketolase (CrtO type)
MADATYDAVVIGGGSKTLIAAMYLARYGGMSVGIFEKNHEAGGGWMTEEMSAPGFLNDCHASSTDPSYHMPVERDFPEWRELGGKYNEFEVAIASIFLEDDSFLKIYSQLADPTQERTAKSIAKHSERDAETWLTRVMALQGRLVPAFFEWLHNPASPPGVPDALEKVLNDPSSGFDPAWAAKTPLEVARDIFESNVLITTFMRQALSMGLLPDTAGFGFLPILPAVPAGGPLPGKWTVVGGTHQFAHAAVKILQAHGAKIFTKHEVDRVIIENGKATGVRLTDGTEVKAKKLVLSGLDPQTLCFRLIGREHLNWQIVRRVENLERKMNCLAWYGWALRELPDYKVAAYDPEVNRASVVLHLVSKDPFCVIREQALLRAGKMPEDLLFSTMNYSLSDKTRAPDGKFAINTEAEVLPANALTEREWLQFKSDHAKAIIKEWQKYAPNMTWDNVIGYGPNTPYDTARRLPNMAPTGTWSVIDMTPSQFGRNRPIPELARHRTPIKNLYATGSAWHPYANASCWQGYNCYKIIAEDYGLEKPWEKGGHPW